MSTLHISHDYIYICFCYFDIPKLSKASFAKLKVMIPVTFVPKFLFINNKNSIF